MLLLHYFQDACHLFFYSSLFAFLLIRCEAELVYLEGLRFLSPGAAQEVLTYRTVSAALDALLCADVGLARDLDHTASGAGGVEEERAQAVEEQELRVRQLQSSVRDQVGVSLHRLLQLQVEHAAQRQALLASKEVQGEVALADRLLDLQKPFPSLDNHEVCSDIVNRRSCTTVLFTHIHNI